MTAAILTVGLQSIRDLLKTGFAPIVALSDDSTAFALAQTTVNPAAGSTTVLAQTATIANVAGSNAFTALVAVNGTTQLTGKNIYTVAACTGTTAAPVAQSRSVRSLPIGVQAGDAYTIGVQITPADNS